MRKTLFILGLALVVFTLSTSAKPSKNKFIKVEDGHFIRDGKPFYYVDANYSDSPKHFALA